MQSLQTSNPSGIIYMTKNDNMVTRLKKKEKKKKKKRKKEKKRRRILSLYFKYSRGKAWSNRSQMKAFQSGIHWKTEISNSGY